MNKSANKGFIIKKTLETHDFGQFTVEKLLVQAPNGNEGEFLLRSGNDFAVVIPVLDDGTLVMIRTPRLGMSEYVLEFPMGQVPGKQGVEVAKIELAEETGYSARRFTHLGTLYPSPGWSKQRAQVYVAQGLTPGTPRPEPMEVISLQKTTISELESYIQHGEVVGMTTIAPFYLFLTKRAEIMR